MSLDFYQDETQQALDRLPSTPTGAIEAPFFQSFLPGGLKVMAGEMAKVGRAVSMAAGVVPVAADALANALPWLPGADMRESPTELQDRFFRQHDEVFGSAVKYWTPQPGEVGMAGEIVGSLAGMLPTIIANPALAVGSQVMSQAEDLVDKGVSTTKAVGVGVAQGAGLATGIWMPILGQNLWQRVVIGGAGFNAVQGVTTRAVSQAILGDDKAAELYPTLGLKELTLDLLLGMAFGGVAHLSPEMRAQGKDAWARIATWAQDLTPAQVDAIAALRQAEHLNVETAPGTLKTPEDVEANVNRAKAALEQVLRDEPVQVEQMPAPRVEPDTARQVDAETRVAEMMADAERVRTEEGIPELLAAEPERPDMPALWGEIARLAPEEQPGAIGAAIERRLAELGVQANEAAANGAIWRSFFDTASKKYGVQAAELMRDYGIDIQRMQARSPGADAALAVAAEGGHLFLQITRDLAARTDAPSAAVADWATLEGWLGIKDGDIPVAAHEQFARGWEKYLAEGVAPTPELKGIFQQFRDWLLQVYRTLTELDVNLNDEIRGVMDRMLASEAADPTPARARATTEAEGAPAPTGRAVPPPPRGEAGEARATPEAQDEPDPWLQVGRENAPAAEPAPARGLEDQEVRDILLVMAEHEAGWAEIGGRHLGGELGQPNFSAWVPRADWWPKREGKLNEAQTKEAVRKALAGEKLKKKEQLAIDYMVKIAGARANDVQAVGKDEWELTAAEVADAGLEPSTRNVVDAALLARANEISEGAVERLAVMFENDDAGFMAAVRRLIDENHQQGRRIRADLEAARRGQETGGQAPGPAGAEPQGPAVAGAGEPAAGSGAGQRPAAEPQGPAGANAAVDPLRQAVDDIVAADPNRMIVVGRNPDGTPIARTVGEYLDEARMQTELARQDAGLFEIAARCMLGGQ